ncbi:MAG: hypothetical protein SFU87_05555 [Chitinophagaceae bacterium]|nr:hypothetical protein [Chitinophagaceae bacterium]
MSFRPWYRYFVNNRDHFTGIDEDDPDTLSEEEKILITSSIQQFQKGENSEGKHLYHASYEMKDVQYVEAMKLFIREEQTHAKVLGWFMDKHHISRINSHWVDAVFRRLRKGFGLQQTLSVLLIAEIIAKVYYKALQRATGSSVLQAICMQILKDEEMHISFQCYTLNILNKRRNTMVQIIYRLFTFFIMTGTIAVVWYGHRKVLKAGGIGFKAFCRSCMKILRECDVLINSYYLPEPVLLNQ